MAIIDGTSLNDTLDSLLDDDVIDGKEGQDAVNYAAAVSAVTVSLKKLGQDQDTGGAGIDRLFSIERLIGSAFGDHLIGDYRTNFVYGGGGADQLFGWSGNDRLYGEAGNDILDGGEGADVMRGGWGDDAYHVDNAGDVIEEWWQDGLGGRDTVIAGVSYTLAEHVENLTLTSTTVGGVTTTLQLSGTGNASRNILIGNSASNRLYGLGGDDRLSGGSGNDRMYGGSGNDVVIGGNANDLLDGGAGDDVLDGERGYDTADYSSASGGVRLDLRLSGPQDTGAAGFDTLIEVENVTGSAFDDHLTGNGLENVLAGGAGDDRLESIGYDSLFGGDGNDELHAINQAFMDGGAGDDRFYLNGAFVMIMEAPGGGEDTVYIRNNMTMPDNVETIVILAPSVSTNSIIARGNADANTFIFEAPGSAYGEGGSDMFVFERSAGRGGIGDFEVGSDKINLSAVFPDGVTLIGSNDFGQNEGAELQAIARLGGYTDLIGRNADGSVAINLRVHTAVPLHASDFIGVTAETSANIVQGTSGDDILIGTAGNDIFLGGEGFDFASYANATAGVGISMYENYDQDTDFGLDRFESIEGLIGSAYDDILIGQGGNQELRGGAGDDTILASTGANILRGGDGNDELRGSDDTGNTMYGGVGDDEYTIGSEGDLVIEGDGEGRDFVSTAMSFTLPGNVEDALSRGGVGGTAALSGNALDNVLTVRIWTGGTALLHGGGGADIFRYEYSAYAGRMEIDDFMNGEDKIDLSNIFANGFEFRGDAGQSGTGDQIWTTHSGDTTILHGMFAMQERFTILLEDLPTPISMSDFIL